MNATELGVRLCRFPQKYLRRSTNRRLFEEVINSNADLLTQKLPDLNWNLEALQRDRSSILDGIQEYGGRSWRWNQSASVWRETDDKLENILERTNSMRENPDSDVRIIWEFNRLQHLLNLSLLAVHDPSVAVQATQRIREQLQSWKNENTPGRGVNYISAMECGLRALSLMYVHRNLSQSPQGDPSILTLIQEIVVFEIFFVSKNLSIGSSLGNHTIAEATSLVVASRVLPSNNSQRWLETGLSTLRKACTKEFLDDGGGAEQSPSYHALILDLLHIVIKLCQKENIKVADLCSLWNKGSKYLRTISFDGLLPNIGDNDSSYSISKYMIASWRDASSQSSDATFYETGTTIVSAGEIQLYFLHGPLGMQPNFAHGHADGLSIILEYKRASILTDSGTFTYSNEAQWRDYFRSAAAHNTLYGGAADQARNVGPFLWSRPSRTKLLLKEKSGDITRLVGELRSRGGYRHRRSISVSPNWVIIVDYADGEEIARVRLRWHLDGLLKNNGQTYCVEDRNIWMTVTGDKHAIHVGSMNPRGGWKSTKYGLLEKISTFECSFEGKKNVIESVFFFSPETTALRDEIRHETEILRSHLPS